MTEYSSLYHRSSTSKNSITGDKDHLYEHLRNSISNAKRIDIIVAFLMESGVRLLVQDFKEAVEKGAALRILCGNYLNITQPQALYLLKDCLGDKVDLRFYNVPNKSFHPKAYMFEYENNSEIFIGSSNVSRSALTNGIEWNYRISSDTSPEDCKYFKLTFEDLFCNHSIIVDDNEMRRYSKSWKRPKVFEDLERLEDTNEDNNIIIKQYIPAAELPNDFNDEDDEARLNKIIQYPRPIGPQIEALYELKKTRLEGSDKGLVVAATGVGKTFLAAFDSILFSKILFLAHREEILNQAERTFTSVRPEIKTGFFSGERKDKEYDALFATVQTLGKKEYLNDKNFSEGTFDYIVIDEFHHAVAESYTNIIKYFRPRFLLGLTATPERLDNQDVFALCDYNLVYDVRLKEAINKGWLVPFRYYGVFDETNYNTIEYRNGKYDERQLERALSKSERADIILQYYLKYQSKRALGFCSSRSHAAYMAKYFSEHGISSCAVISGNTTLNGDVSETLSESYVMDRTEAIKKLIKAEIRIIFSVDMFNEGLDIPQIDMVMFLRPTESPTVFLQQLGRGLRKQHNKKYLNIIDFIGNYKKANLIPYFLMGDLTDNRKRGKQTIIPDEDDYPDGCFVNFDLRIINLFKHMAEEEKGLFERVKDEYLRIKEERVEKPLRLSMYTYMDESIYAAIKIRNDLNIFRDYLSFLDKIHDIDDAEKALIGTKAHEFLKEIENTSMSKLYKMPILLAFYNYGEMKHTIDDEDIYSSFKEFYSKGSNAIDMKKDKSTSNYKDWGKREYVNLAKSRPIHYFQQSAPNFFFEQSDLFCLTAKLKEFIHNPVFIRHFKDIIDYRTRRFYKERLEKSIIENEKVKENQNAIRFVIRDEYVNIMAMTLGGIDTKYSHQIFICKKSPISNEKALFLLDAKKSSSTFSLSPEGNRYFSNLTKDKESDFILEYAARIDCQLKVQITPELFKTLYKEGLFQIWAPDAPMEYFKGFNEGYLVVFRVYKLKQPVLPEMLEKGRKGRNYLFRLNEERDVDIDQPVIDEQMYNEMKSNLENLLKKNNWLA